MPQRDVRESYYSWAPPPHHQDSEVEALREPDWSISQPLRDVNDPASSSRPRSQDEHRVPE